MKNPSNNIRIRKPDLSPYLFHFISNDTPINIMNNILLEKRLKTDKLEYICFTESPLSQSMEQFKYMYSFCPYKEPMYSKFGIGFNRDLLIKEYNARPVIYGDINEYNLLPTTLRWRFENLNIENHDYTWLREWRIKGRIFDFSEVSYEDIIIVTPTRKDLEEIAFESELDEIDFSFEDGTCYPYPIYRLTRIWKGITIEEANSCNNDYEMKAMVDKQ